MKAQKLLTAPVNKILDHTLVDGPGNRTAIFLQGCNLACRYCHNPETQRLCCDCGRCVAVCPAGALKLNGSKADTDQTAIGKAAAGKSLTGTVIWDHRLCVSCDRCIKICPHYSSPKVSAMTVDDVFSAVADNLPFIRGITVSGGECALYLPFLTELFIKCRDIGLTCLLDTNGTIPLWDDPVMAVCDGVMLDVKAWDDNTFFRLTDGHNDIVKKNLRELARMDKLTELRIVCFEQEDLVDAAQVIGGIARNVTKQVKEQTLLKLIRFRSNGVTGALSQTAPPSLNRMKQLRQTAIEHGFQKIRIV